MPCSTPQAPACLATAPFMVGGAQLLYRIGLDCGWYGGLKHPVVCRVNTPHVLLPCCLSRCRALPVYPHMPHRRLLAVNLPAGGGGGLKMMSGVCLLKGCTLRGNRATYGGALEVGHHACCCFCCKLGRVCAGWLLVAWPAHTALFAAC